ncbi:Predicted dehydrogenase [Burkholderia sp. WP9]|uniref:Gfo/Idh/MocA family protein n=1 Tax=Burkholderia sp. WP9 TaxID=1500263 RepID=UPI0008988882|nr:Gfo/Idh/MocA family oxidoreductase [Burkholderia sp. WP9]SEF14356.1 Predicted dehydrogenase [Burkholderia sp. WP9]
MGSKIRVGIIGSGGWARYGHIPALQALDSFKVVALAGRNKEKVQKYADEFNIEHAFDNADELVAHPGVDLVVVLAPSPEHGRLTEAAIAAGKDVYTEWPLSTTTAESEKILAMAEAKGVKHVVGLQRRFSPSSRYWRDLVQQGYVGKIRAVRMSVGVDAFGEVMPEFAKWALDAANFTDVLSIYGGHFQDMLFHGVGFPAKLTAVMTNQFPVTTIAETGEKIAYTSPNEVMVIGTLSGGGLFSVQLEGAQVHRTGLQIDVTGTAGALRITNARGFQNTEDNAIAGMNKGTDTFVALPIPATYASLPVSHLDASAQDVAYLYAAYARDKETGSADATSFKDAVRQHRLIDQIAQTSGSFFK